MFPKIRVFGVVVLASAWLMPVFAVGQAPPSVQDQVTPKEEQSGPKDCVPSRSTTGRGPELEVPEGRSLSEQLAAGQGVICPPPRVDPEMTKPVPGGGTMPVIPPPGADEDRNGVEPR